MKPLIVLIAGFAAGCLVTFIITHHVNLYLSGRTAMATMLILTSFGHFVFNKGMVLMLPRFMPFKKIVIYLTGIIEIAAAIGLLIPGTYHITGILLILFFILALPANIIAAKQNVNLEKASYDGKGLPYLWFRVPLQAFFICWVLYFAVLH
jgi:uncharacterized membrane protein